MADDPRVLVRGFLDDLPATIKKGLICSVARFYSGRHQLPFTEAETIIAEALRSQDDAVAVSRAVTFICAAIDHVLTQGSMHAKRGATLLRLAARDTQDQGLLAAVLGEPLRARHAEQVDSQWAALRSEKLTAQMIVDFEYSLLVKQINWLRSE